MLHDDFHYTSEVRLGYRSSLYTDTISQNNRVANAGIAQVKSLLDLTPDDFERMFRINVFGVHNCHSTAAKQLISQGNCTMENPGKKKKDQEPILTAPHHPNPTL